MSGNAGHTCFDLSTKVGSEAETPRLRLRPRGGVFRNPEDPVITLIYDTGGVKAGLRGSGRGVFGRFDERRNVIGIRRARYSTVLEKEKVNVNRISLSGDGGVQGEDQEK